MTDQAKEDLSGLPEQPRDTEQEHSAEMSASKPAAESVGLQLARRRQELGWSVEQVAGRLNLAQRQIDALESDNLSALPGLASARGFVRAYAKLMVMDAAPLVASLAQEAGPQEEAIPLRRPISTTPFAPVKLAPMRPVGRKNWVWALLGVALVAVVVGGAWKSGLLNFSSEPAAPAASAPAAQAPTASASAEGQAAQASSPAEGGAAPASPATAAQVAPAAPVAPPPSAPAPASNASTSTGSDAAGITAAGGNAVAPAAGAESAKPVASANALVIKAREKCWIEVKRGDKPSVTRTLAAGSSETIDTTGGVSVVVGNVPGVEVSLGGKPLDLRDKARNNVARVDIK